MKLVKDMLLNKPSYEIPNIYIYIYIYIYIPDKKK